jgi:hypothetical protein
MPTSGGLFDGCPWGGTHRAIKPSSTRHSPAAEPEELQSQRGLEGAAEHAVSVDEAAFGPASRSTADCRGWSGP